MTTIAVWPIDGERAGQALAETRCKLDNADGEVVLDFSSVRRVDAEALREMELLAAAAAEKPVKVSLRGISPDVYKVLKLMKLGSRFTFLA